MKPSWNIIVTIILIFVNSLSTFGNKNDSICFKENDIDFLTHLEKKLILSNTINSDSLIILSTFAYGDSSYYKRSDCLSILKNFTKGLRDDNIDELKPEKKVKIIYQKVHERFFKKYDLNASINEIFKDGLYNCVSASCIYAYLFDYFKIEYTVKESATHVFLIAYPGTKDIKVETTDPKAGYIYYTSKYKENFINYLFNQKMVTNFDLSNDGIDATFNKFYFDQKNISFKQLVALLYYNKGIEFYNNQDLANALNCFLKSYFMYRSEKIEFLIYSAIAQLINNTEYIQEKNWNRIVFSSRLVPKLFTTESIKYMFALLTQKILVDNGDDQTYNRAFKYFETNITDSACLVEIKQIYHTEASRFYAASNNIEYEYYHLDAAYSMLPNNYQIKEAFCNSFLRKISLIEDPDTCIFLFKKFYVEHPNFKNQYEFIGKCNDFICFKIVSPAFVGKIDETDRLLESYEVFMGRLKNDGLIFNSQSFERVYVELASSYYKHNNKKKAKNVVDRGLTFAPNNKRLQASRKLFQ